MGVPKLPQLRKAQDGSYAAPPKETVVGFTKVITTAALEANCNSADAMMATDNLGNH